MICDMYSTAQQCSLGRRERKAKAGTGRAGYGEKHTRQRQRQRQSKEWNGMERFDIGHTSREWTRTRD
ncbi:hypothetical protein BCR44DRAFT_1432937, partial [Catenaria anguillulae PL171]